MSLLDRDARPRNLLGRLDEVERRIKELLRIATPPTVLTDLYGTWLTATATWDPANLATDGAATSTTVTVTGAQVGNTAWATHNQIGANDVLISAHVQAADTVRVVIMNKSGGALNIGSGTLTVHVRQ